MCCGQTWSFFNPLGRSALRGSVRFGDERTAAQFLVDHLARAHGVETVQGVVVTDVRVCTGFGGLCDSQTIFNPDPTVPVLQQLRGHDVASCAHSRR